MTTKPNPIRKSSRLEKIRSCRPALLLFALQLIAFSAINVRAQTLIWDANGGSGPADGSGTWHTAGDWWNGTTTVSWTDGLGATFGSGSGSAGSYTVNVDSPVTVTNLMGSGTCCTLADASFTPVAVTAGTRYWVVANTPASGQGSDFVGVWDWVSKIILFGGSNGVDGWQGINVDGLPAGAVLGTIP